MGRAYALAVPEDGLLLWYFTRLKAYNVPGPAEVCYAPLFPVLVETILLFPEIKKKRADD